MTNAFPTLSSHSYLKKYIKLSHINGQNASHEHISWPFACFDTLAINADMYHTPISINTIYQIGTHRVLPAR